MAADVILFLEYLQKILTISFSLAFKKQNICYQFYFPLLCKKLATVVLKLLLSYLSPSGSSVTFPSEFSI